MLDIYRTIKERRQELGLSQQELAEKVGYTGKSMISKVERGEVDLSTTMIKKFAEALCMSASDLLDEKPVIPTVDAECLEFMELFSRLDKEKRNIIKNLIKSLLND